MSEERTRRRFQRRAKGLAYPVTELGSKVLAYPLVALSDYMQSPDAPKPPDGLETVVRQLSADDLALAALGPLLHQIDVGWDWNDPSAPMKIHLAVGKALRDRLELRGLLMHDKKAHDRLLKAADKHRAFARERKHHPTWKYRVLNWQESDCCYAGVWLVGCAMALDFFYLDEKGFPKIADDHRVAVDALREELTYRDPIFLPSLEPPKPWTGWRNYLKDGERISATFVRNCPSAESTISKAFRQRAAFKHDEERSLQFQHVDAVNALQAVPWQINTRMIDVVRRFAGIKKGAGETQVGKRVSDDRVKHDVATAKWLAKHSRFYLPHNCDFRGRIFPIPDFSFHREDHVRALFQFANGKPIGSGEIFLKIHLANMAGIKGDWPPRLDWVAKHRDLIERTALNPMTATEWQRYPEPFRFVAGCIELVGAWKEGASFITRLPVLFDATCSGLQHLAALAGDEETARQVNLADSDVRHDLYQTMTDAMIKRLEAGPPYIEPKKPKRKPKPKPAGRKPGPSEKEMATWWLAQERINRSLIKRPASTYAYSVTVRGMRDQIIEAYRDQHELAEPRDEYATFLAKLVFDVTEKAVPKCAGVMRFIRMLAKECNKAGRPLRWRSPSGFLVSSAAYEPNIIEVDSPLRGERVRYRVSDGFKPKLKKRACLDAAVPNFVHSQDAAHLAVSINQLAKKDITDVAGIHDCFGGLAPEVQVIRETVRSQFDLLYRTHDWLRALHRHNESNVEPPERGRLGNWFEPQRAEHMIT